MPDEITEASELAQTAVITSYQAGISGRAADDWRAPLVVHVLVLIEGRQRAERLLALRAVTDAHRPSTLLAASG